jgi:signal transduction histidine kinase
MGLVSYMAVPMMARGRTLGVISLISSESHRRYGLADLQLAQDLARRVAIAMDNARLYRESQALNEELEQRVVRRTIELQNMNRQLEVEITNRERMNVQLRSLSGYLQSAREEERIRIAREIHDEIGQVLTAVKMDLALLARELPASGDKLSREEIQQSIRATVTLVDNALQTMHNIIRELRPEVLDHLGLKSALEWQIQEFQTRTRIECSFESDIEDAELDPERSTAVFRILQETLTNIARHANASKVDVELRRENNSLLLDVQDNGQGISESNVANSSRFGILGMRERARALGGSVEVRGNPGQGTRVSARIPLQTTDLSNST